MVGGREHQRHDRWPGSSSAIQKQRHRRGLAARSSPSRRARATTASRTGNENGTTRSSTSAASGPVCVEAKALSRVGWTLSTSDGGIDLVQHHRDHAQRLRVRRAPTDRRRRARRPADCPARRARSAPDCASPPSRSPECRDRAAGRAGTPSPRACRCPASRSRRRPRARRSSPPAHGSGRSPANGCRPSRRSRRRSRPAWQQRARPPRDRRRPAPSAWRPRHRDAWRWCRPAPGLCMRGLLMLQPQRLEEAVGLGRAHASAGAEKGQRHEAAAFQQRRAGAARCRPATGPVDSTRARPARRASRLRPFAALEPLGAVVEGGSAGWRAAGRHRHRPDRARSAPRRRAAGIRGCRNGGRRPCRGRSSCRSPCDRACPASRR